MPYVLLILAFVCNAAANVLLKLGAEKGLAFSGVAGTFLHNWQALLGVLLFAVNVIFYFLALRALSLSIAYPIMVGMSFLLASLAALYLLNEPIGWQQVLGYALIIAGVTIVAGYAR